MQQRILRRYASKHNQSDEMSGRLPEYLWPAILSNWVREGAFFAGKLLTYTSNWSRSKPGPKDVQILWKGLSPAELRAIGQSAVDLADYMEKGRNRTGGTKTRELERETMRTGRG